MNLFNEETKTDLLKYMTEDWAEVMSNYINVSSFNAIKFKVSELRKTNIVYPEPNDIFKAFRYNYEKVKVVIIGQDPYFNGNADGLSFSCKNTLSPSLSQVIQAIFKDEIINFDNHLAAALQLKYYLANKNNWNLEYLAQQGVMLFNPTLTVNQGQAGSHKGIWDNFTKAVFNSLASKENLVYLIWGNDAKESLMKIPLINHNQLRLFNEHPAAASYRKDLWKCNHFTKCNEYLKNKNLTEIEWIQR